jgi:RHS repeat-associated protein
VVVRSVSRVQVGSKRAISKTYTYDGAGLRAAQTVFGTTIHLTWDTSAGLPLLLSNGSTNYIYGPGGLPIEQISEETPTFYHHDQLGSTRMLTNSSGEATATFTYGAYGQPAGSTGSQTTPLGFAGQYTNEQSGLQYLRARVYDPVTGQFITRDPLEALTREPYAYTGDNPVNGIDPSGLHGAEEELPCPWCLPAPPPLETWKKAGEELVEPFENLWNSIFGNSSEHPSALEQHQFAIGRCEEEETGWSLSESEPTPPGYNPDTWEKRPASRPSDPGENYYDPNGREWRWHAPDKYHPKGHWDRKEPGKSGEWRNVYP